MSQSTDSSFAPLESSEQNQRFTRFLPYLIFIILVGFAIGWFLKQMLPLSVWTNVQYAPSATPVNQKPILFGAIVPLTGDGAYIGIPAQQVAVLIQKQINKNGGIGGRRLDIVWEDGRCEKKDAEAGAQRLIYEKRVQFLLAGMCSSEFLAAAPIAQREKILSFSPSATSPEISKLGKYIFRTIPSDALAGKAAAQYAYTKMFARKAAIVTQDKEYPLALREVFTRDFTLLGGTIVADEVFDTGTTDFTPIVQAVKQTAPDIVYILPQAKNPGILLVASLKENNVTSGILTAEVLVDRGVIAEHSKILDGVTGLEIFFDEKLPKSKELLDLYMKEYNVVPAYPAFMSGMRDVLYLIKEAYERVGEDPDAIASYLYELKDWEGAVGKLNFDQHGDPTFAYSIKKIIAGESAQVEVYTPLE